MNKLLLFYSSFRSRSQKITRCHASSLLSVIMNCIVSQ